MSPIVGASNCAAYATQKVEEAFRNESFEGTGIDGVVCFPHGDGCGQAEGPDTQLLRHTLEGLADHPNVAAAVMVGLGCEVNQVSYYLRDGVNGNGAAPRRGFTLQESGGTRHAIADSVKAVRELIAEVGRSERVECPASKLVVGLECGGSDAFSGITANPAVGYCSDLVVKQGGTSCLAETTEVYGAEHLLTRRAVSREVGEKLLAKIEWYKRYVAGFQGAPTFDNNPSPGNKAGGLTNIAEKSLGAVAKGGTSNLAGVYEFAERIARDRLRLHEHAGVRPDVCDGHGRGRLQYLSVHHRPRKLFRLPYDPGDQDRVELEHRRAHGRRHGHQRRHHRRRRGRHRRRRHAHLRADRGSRVRTKDLQRSAGSSRVHALAHRPRSLTKAKPSAATGWVPQRFGFSGPLGKAPGLPQAVYRRETTFAVRADS